MALVIKSNNALDVMEQWVRQSDFKSILNHRLTKPDYQIISTIIITIIEPPLNNLPQITKYKLNSESKSLVVGFQLTGMDRLYQSKPLSLLNSLISSNGPQGLSRYISDIGLSFASTQYMDTNSAFTFYLLEVELKNNIVIPIIEVKQ